MECGGKVTTSGRAVVTYLLEAVSLSTHRALVLLTWEGLRSCKNFDGITETSDHCRVLDDGLEDGEGIGDDERKAEDGEAAALNLNKIYFGVTELWPTRNIHIC